MNVNVAFGDMRSGLIDNSGSFDLINPSMDVYFNLDSNGKGFYSDHQNGRTLRIIKVCQKYHQQTSKIKHQEPCDTLIVIVLLTPGNECEKFSAELKQIVRPGTCDEELCVPLNHTNHFKCSIAGAHLALDVIVKVSSESFEIQSNKWLEEVRNFIDHGPIGTSPFK